MINYERGSEWRRWDLHIHTPGTLKNDQYAGDTLEEKWNNFYSAVSQYIGDGNDPLRSIEAVGVTDYLSIDNYNKVMKDHRLPESIKLVLPNVELRMVPFAKSSPVNIHCIFDPLYSGSLESRFFSKLKFSFRGSSYSASHDELRRLGRDYKNDRSISDEKAYSIGVNQFVLEFSALKKIFDDDHELREHCIIAVSNASGDGASGIVAHSTYFTGDTSQMDATRQAIYQFTDMIFSAKSSDVKYFVGAGVDSREIVIRKCGSLKACVHGSDAHSRDRLFEPDNRNYCWIKADPTFNGFRQILYEPEDRVRISAIRPEVKPDYQVIDRIEISDRDFAPTPIYFNDRLTCIIGGKSTGKSLLLHNIALAIDPNQVSAKTNVTKNGSKAIAEVKVFWRDGSISQKGLFSQNHKIVYIPQTYLNRLSDEHEELTEIDTIIHDIVMMNEDVSHSYVEMLQGIGALKTEIDKSIYALIQQYTEWQNRVKELSEIGTRSGIEREIKKLKAEKDEISKQLSLSKEDVSAYEDLSKGIISLDSAISSLGKSVKAIQEIQSLVMIVDEDYDLSAELLERIRISGEMAVKAADEIWYKDRTQIISELEEALKGAKEQRAQKVALAEPLSVKISENEAVKKLSDAVQQEEGKLAKFIEIEAQANRGQEKYYELLKQLATSFIKYRAIHQAYSDSINTNSALTTEDLEFSAEVPFRKEAFSQEVRSCFDRRISIKNYIDLDSYDESWFTDEHVSDLINAVIDGSIRLVKNKTPENVLRSLLGDWYNSAYKVSMDGDLIDEMSPGKKATVYKGLQAV